MIIENIEQAKNFINNAIEQGFIVHNTVLRHFEVRKDLTFLTGYGYRSRTTDDLNQFVGFNIELIDK